MESVMKALQANGGKGKKKEMNSNSVDRIQITVQGVQAMIVFLMMIILRAVMFAPKVKSILWKETRNSISKSVTSDKGIALKVRWYYIYRRKSFI